MTSSRQSFTSKLDDLDPSANFASILDQIISTIRIDPLYLHRMLTIDACYQICENALIVVCVLVRQFPFPSVSLQLAIAVFMGC